MDKCSQKILANRKLFDNTDEIATDYGLKESTFERGRGEFVGGSRPPAKQETGVGEEFLRIHRGRLLARFLRRERSDDFLEARIAAERVPEGKQF